jgi:hypothetical protein
MSEQVIILFIKSIYFNSYLWDGIFGEITFI